MHVSSDRIGLLLTAMAAAASAVGLGVDTQAKDKSDCMRNGER
jgi:hypothetical protein